MRYYTIINLVRVWYCLPEKDYVTEGLEFECHIVCLFYLCYNRRPHDAPLFFRVHMSDPTFALYGITEDGVIFLFIFSSSNIRPQLQILCNDITEDCMVFQFRFLTNVRSFVRWVWRYQRGNQNPYIEEQTTTWPKEKNTKGQTTIYKAYT